MKLFVLVAVVSCILAALIPSQQAVKILNNCAGMKPNSFDRIFVMMFENHGYIETIRQPYFKTLVKEFGMSMAHYHAVTHPSQPNYITQIAGDYFGLKNDSAVSYNIKHLVDLLEAKNITWKSYQENYPMDSKLYNEHGCFMGGTSPDGLYYRKHNPFMSMTSITQSSARCKNIVNADQLFQDITNKNLPQFMYYTPNIDNDAHNKPISFANDYLSQFLPKLLKDDYFMKNTLIVITFDEDEYVELNHIYTVLIGSMVQKGSTDFTQGYTHYSLLRTVEENWQLGTLGRNDDKAIPYQCLQ